MCGTLRDSPFCQAAEPEQETAHLPLKPEAPFRPKLFAFGKKELEAKQIPKKGLPLSRYRKMAFPNPGPGGFPWLFESPNARKTDPPLGGLNSRHGHLRRETHRSKPFCTLCRFPIRNRRSHHKLPLVEGIPLTFGL